MYAYVLMSHFANVVEKSNKYLFIAYADDLFMAKSIQCTFVTWIILFDILYLFQ